MLQINNHHALPCFHKALDAVWYVIVLTYIVPAGVVIGWTQMGVNVDCADLLLYRLC